ncbi:hypothetical protein BSE24067_02318 [Burkholderia seminalis]|nr:hypothetical protein BSE24067_02318 [Burkholderia seminalis]
MGQKSPVAHRRATPGRFHESSLVASWLKAYLTSGRSE